MPKDNRELLNYIFQNAQMGVDTISQLLEISEDDKFLHQLKTQKDEYSKISNDAKQLLSKTHTSPDDLSAFDKVRTYLMISVQTLTDKSTSHIAQMMMEGSTMGIVQAIRKIRNYTEVDDEVSSLMKRLLKFEENNFEQLKKYI